MGLGANSNLGPMLILLLLGKLHETSNLFLKDGKFTS